MNTIAYADQIRTHTPKPVAKLAKDAAERWAERVIDLGLLAQGAAGAAEYLRRFGRGISAEKCAALALEAEKQKAQAQTLGAADAALANFDTFSTAFWVKAAELNA